MEGPLTGQQGSVQVRDKYDVITERNVETQN